VTKFKGVNSLKRKIQWDKKKVVERIEEARNGGGKNVGN